MGKMLVCEINSTEINLNSTKNARQELFKSIRTSEVEAWKQSKADAFSKLIQNKKAVICDISERNFTLNKLPRRQAMLAQIRAAYNIPESWTFMESWKEFTRNSRSEVMLAHKHCMVSVEQGQVTLKMTKVSTRKEQLQACLVQIRKEPVEAWKKKSSGI